MTFAHADGVVHVGEEYRGGDPVVEANWTAFVDGDTLPQRDAEPVGLAAARRPSTRRRRRCGASRSRSTGRWSPSSTPRFRCDGHPNSPGATSGAPPPFFRSTLRAGQVCDILSDVVRKNPSWFRWPGRDVTLDDVERMERLEGMEPEQAA